MRPGTWPADRLLGTAVCCSAEHTQSGKPRGSCPGRMGIPVPTSSFPALWGLCRPWGVLSRWLSPVLLPLACQQFLKALLKKASGPQCCCHSITPRMSSPPLRLYSYMASSVHAHMHICTQTHTRPPTEAHAGCVSNINCCEQESFFFTI